MTSKVGRALARQSSTDFSPYKVERTSVRSTVRATKPVLLVIGVILLCTSCSIYKPYERPAKVDSMALQSYRTDGIEQLQLDSLHFGRVAWREVFTDPYLQELMATALDSNFDLRNALLQVQQMQARLFQARMAFTPFLNLNASYGLSGSTVEGAGLNQPYSIGLAGSWEIDIFGKVLNAKRGAAANYLKSEAGRREVQTQIIASVASAYYSLLMLDKKLEISRQTIEYWDASLEVMEALKLAGSMNQAAIEQARANSLAVKAGIPDLERNIRELENSLSLLTGRPGGSIARGSFDDSALPENLAVGLPGQLLLDRPDVAAAEAALMSAYYGTAAARAAFFPSFTIGANGSWTNSAGGAILNPAAFVFQLALSLVQPLVNRGTLAANLRVAKAQQEIALNNFQKTFLNAANEVSNILYQYQSSALKCAYRAEQVTALEKAVEHTSALMRLGGSGHTYLEVLTAQQSLLSAQMSLLSDQYEHLGCIISLYRALGGGSR